jgi:hypothetical protein
VTESQTNKTTILRSSLKARELRAFEYLFEEDLNKLYGLHWDDPGLVFLTKPACAVNPFHSSCSEANGNYCWRFRRLTLRRWPTSSETTPTGPN